MAEAGLETRVSLFQVAPLVRFTHWGAGNPPGSTRAVPNQAELLIEFTLGNRLNR
jgi:hypothetical protein